eukprot:m.7209 g.7209  ORF g.7209 m.7209 type:complete len:57 (-) comp3932_c0_seq2:756-926(-)
MRVEVQSYSALLSISLQMYTPPPAEAPSFLVVDSCTENPVLSPAAKAPPSSLKERY